MSYFKFSLYQGNTTKKGSPIKLVIRKQNDRKLIALGIYANPNQWDEEQQRFKTGKGKELHPDRIKNNEYLNRKEIEANDIIDEFEKLKIDWSLNQFEDKFLNKSHQGSVSTFFDDMLHDLNETGHIGNALCYKSTYHMLQLFDSDIEKRTFNELDYRYISKFDTWLQTPRETKYKGDRIIERKGCSGNTRKYYHKALRAVLNKAIQLGQASKATYPYGKGKFEVGRLEETTKKRYLVNSDIDKIKTTNINNLRTELIRRLFIFSYYCHGISYVDMAQLTTDNVQNLEDGKYIVYKRQKIKNQKNTKPLSIKIFPEIEELIKWFAENTIRIGNYLTPCITRDYQGEELYKHIINRSHRYNEGLKLLAKELKINVNLTSYVARHTMAMRLKTNGVSTEIIQQVCGHSNLKTTAVYLDDFNNEIVNNAVEIL